ncbi:multi-sensor hybrid histidine kinase [Naegleria gruberi]|uniref:Multi-sensor hybrid histidine kinase n=1 Tax=Naegleria gruberi TaxID=5762 RepID=D2V1I8_NAEGR|nr:multi-sensor hybrid histidine kinase [Naegleria gruberi]EFC49171.1 multi-sensor hybrid histidine kinase [Naegleria gruberi]|eukprot:XP_002681915.1 multi-sensor hybrid histidine kinase [Naegleria gruberi strain NEG-M]
MTQHHCDSVLSTSSPISSSFSSVESLAGKELENHSSSSVGVGAESDIQYNNNQQVQHESLSNNMHPNHHHNTTTTTSNVDEPIHRPSLRKNSTTDEFFLPLSYIHFSGSSSIPDYWKPFMSLQSFLLVGIVYFAYFLNILYCFHSGGMTNGLLMLLVNASTVGVNFYWFFYTVNPNVKVLIFNLLMFTCRFSLVHNKMMVLPSVFSTITTTSKGSLNSPFKAFFPIVYTCAHYFIWGMAKYEFNLMDMDSLLEFLFHYGTLIISALLFGIYNLYLMIQLSSECKAMKEATRKIQTALDVKSDFLSHITHEFRVPCLSSLGSISLLKETELAPQQLDFIATIESANNILLSLIEDILLFAKTEHDVNHPPKETSYISFSLFNSINSLYSLTKGYATNFKVDVKFYIDKNIQNMKVFFNHTKLQQCLSNLLTNAIKASKPNDTVQLKCEILGNGQNEGETIFQFQVIDHGIGIPKERQKDLFVPFAQLHQINEDLVPSSGLGLVTCLNIVKSVNGTIDLFSENGTTIFTVQIPMKASNIEQEDILNFFEEPSKLNTSLKRQLQVHTDYLYRMEQDKKILTNRESNPNSSLPKIILAEDNFVNRKVLIKLFESLGQSLDSVRDGKELVDSFKPEQHKLIITDMHMPILNGLEASKVIREKHPNSKIVMITADALINISSYLEVVDKVISKPCSKDDLKKVISEYL